MTTRASHFSLAAALALCCAAAFVGSGCRQAQRQAHTPTSLPQAVESTGQAATVVREAANSIGEANAEIQSAVPEVAPQTTQIAAGVDRLHAVEQSLRQTQTALAAEAKLSTGMAKDLAKANDRIRQLEDKANGTLNTILIGVSLAGLTLAVVSAVWWREWKGIMTGLAIFAACTCGMWILKYRAIIAICGFGIALAYAAWVVIVERRAFKQVVATVDDIKPFDPDFKAKANKHQKPITRRIVDRIKGTA